MPLIQLQDIKKVYDLGEVKVEALRGVSLNIEPGEYLALVGPSGSGKSTLMNILGCLDRPSSGSYRLADQEVASLSVDERAQVRNQRIGFVFQNFNLLARTSALENVELPLLYVRGLSATQRRKRATELLRRVGLSDRLDHHPSQLSGGQQQRVAIARSLANNPAILMCDEPTGNLDTRTSKEVIRLFRQLNQESGITVILVTHDQEVAHTAPRIVVLRDGNVLQDGSDFKQAMDALHSSDLATEEAEQSAESK
jgi:putative ABC transport system ATP-binding protein